MDYFPKSCKVVVMEKRTGFFWRIVNFFGEPLKEAANPSDTKTEAKTLGREAAAEYRKEMKLKITARKEQIVNRFNGPWPKNWKKLAAERDKLAKMERGL